MPWRIEHLESTSSTNDVARQRILDAWSRGQSADGIVITAQRQQSGRGQHGRRWESPPGGLYFSAIAESSPPNEIPPDIRNKMALVAGVAVAQALQSPHTKISLRWPNDLMAGPDMNLKLGGILCEGLASGDRWAAIIGIGINVSINLADLPPSLQSRATSLQLIDPTPRTLDSVLQAILHQLATEITSLHQGQNIAHFARRAQSIDSLHHRHIEIQTPNGNLAGTCHGIADNGELLLQTPTGPHSIDIGTLISVDHQPLR